MMEPKPNFLVIGAGRSGTTSLHHYLSKHPEVFVAAVKSPSYFYAVDAPDKGRHRETREFFVDTKSGYEALFADSGGYPVRGEVSPAYLASMRVPDRIASELEDVRAIAILRNPTDRLIARFTARRRDGLESARTIREVVERDIARGIDLTDTAGTYVAAGFVSEVLQRYIELLGVDRVSLHVYEDFLSDSRRTLSSIFEFLDVDPNAEIDVSTRHNSSKGVISQPLLQELWEKSSGLRQTLRPVVPRRARNALFDRLTRRTTPVVVEPEERAMIDDLYVDEIGKLAKILDRDLSSWSGRP